MSFLMAEEYAIEECFILMESFVPTLLQQHPPGPVLEICPLLGPQSTVHKHLPVCYSFHLGPADLTWSGRSVLSQYPTPGTAPSTPWENRGGTLGSPWLCGCPSWPPPLAPGGGGCPLVELLGSGARAQSGLPVGCVSCPDHFPGSPPGPESSPSPVQTPGHPRTSHLPRREDQSPSSTSEAGT